MYHFNLKHMSFNTKSRIPRGQLAQARPRRKNAGVVRVEPDPSSAGEEESAEENLGDEETGWNICGLCGKFAEHGGMKDPAFADSPEMDIRLGCKDICQHVRHPRPYAKGAVPALKRAQEKKAFANTVN